MVGGLSVINAAAGAYSDDLPLLVISGLMIQNFLIIQGMNYLNTTIF